MNIIALPVPIQVDQKWNSVFQTEFEKLVNYLQELFKLFCPARKLSENGRKIWFFYQYWYTCYLQICICKYINLMMKKIWWWYNICNTDIYVSIASCGWWLSEYGAIPLMIEIKSYELINWINGTWMVADRSRW